MADHSIRGKVALIAGGAKNLGGLIARDLAGHGARAVVVHYNSESSRAEAETTVAAVRALGAEAVALQGDLTRAGAVERLLQRPWTPWAGRTLPSTPWARCSRSR